MYQSIIRKILDNVKNAPDTIAIIDQGEGNQFTYSEFEAYARRVAGKLSRLGVSRNDFVTIELPRNKEYIASMAAVWMTGAAFVPLSPAYPAERVQFIRSDCSAKAVIDSAFLENIGNEAPIEDIASVEPSDHSLMIYTSGSTGKPKGVLHSHLSISDSVFRFLEYADSPAGFRAAVGAPFTFVASVQGVFEPLCAINTAVLVPYEAMRDPVLLADFIEQYQVNRCFISPKMLRVFKAKGNSLKIVSTGSERVSNTYSADYTIQVAYGQTESAGAVMMFRIDKKYDNTPIGKPIGNVKAYLLDENNQPADEGEMCLAGNFATGYLNLPELTEKTFIPNPFFEQDGFPKLLKTGDICKKGENGNYIYLNRKDWMVKINGQRVEPGEIEAVLKNTDGIADAAIKDFKNTFGQVYLVAYYTEKEAVDVEALKAKVSAQLPPYMIPSFFVRLDKLPVNQNGKLDRNALIPPEAGEFKNEYAAPETELQKALCSAFEKILEAENVGIDDDFYALGGDSIKSAMIARECEAYHLSTAVILAGKTPRGIEHMIKRSAQKAFVVRKENKPKVYPLTSSERGMYLEQKLYPDSVSFNLNIGVMISGADAEAVRTTLESIFSSHEAFRSTYGEENGLPVRIVTDRLPQIIEKTAAAREDVIKIIDSYAEPFDLCADIPVRPTLYTISDGEVILHMAIHHIAFDGGSAKPFITELIDGLNGKMPEAATIDLSDLYDCQTEEQHENGLAYYRNVFADGVPVNEMPTKARRPKVHPVSDREIAFDLDTAKARLMDKAARKFGVTRFELIFAAISMALGKYTSSEDVVLGIPTDMRPNGAEGVIGMFVNTAPVRVKPVRSMELNDYFAAVSEAVRGATYGASLPFEDIVAEFVKTRDESRSPIFDVSVNYLQKPAVYRSSGLIVDMYSPLQNMTRDIAIVISNSEDGMRFVARYSGELFEDDMIESFLGQVRHTVDIFTGSEAKTVRDALALPEAQAERLEAFSSEATAEISDVLLHRVFERAASASPEKTALIACDKTVSFEELNNNANRIAHSLMEKGIKPGDSVVLLLPRRSFYFEAVFGVLKSGAAFVPCDPEYPPDRISHITEDSGSRFIITTEDRAADHPSEKTLIIHSLYENSDTEDPDVQMSGQDLAYMIYTSGSTGKPKGVMLTHAGICSFCTTHPANILYQLADEQIDTMLAVTTVSFDLSLKDTLGILCNGKTVVFASETEMNDPRELTALINKNHVDAMNATPSRYMQYMEYEPFCEALRGCTLVMAGGELFPAALLEKLKSLEIPHIINTYGPTETTISCNMAFLQNLDHVTVGRPLLNYKEYIVDKFGDPAPCGVVGELYVGGPGVARGYRNLPEKTAQSFVDYRGQRMYRTGDYAKFDREGKVYILGRLDSQVKLRGLRIELSEIEELIAAQPHIKKAAVVIRKLGGQDNLCAYFTADTEIDINALRSELKKHLTHYMVPAAFLQMEELPVTANGKTDTKSLPELTLEARQTTAPQSEMQQRIFDIAAEVLGNSNFGIETELYAAGLTSLNSVGFCIRLSDAFGVTVQIRDLRDNDTIEKLEVFIRTLEQQDTEEFEIFDEYSITKTQEGIFFETMSHPDITIYNIPTLLKIDKAIDTERLKKAVAAAVNAHPYLMTKMFISKMGEIRQKRAERSFDESEITDIRCGNIEEVKNDLVKPFDIENEKLYRFSVIETDEGKYLFLDIHHIVFDGESKKILLRDITAAYNGETLTPEKYSGYEAALSEQKLRAGEHYDRSKKYYTELLDGVESDCLPIGDVLSDSQKKDGGTLNLSGKESVPSSVRAYCAENHVSENAFYTAVFGWLLGKYCGREDDSLFMTVNNGRNDPRFRDSVSMFVRTYPVLCKLSTNSVSDYISEIGKQLSDSLQYDVYSFAEISHDLHVSADVLFVYQSTMTDGKTFTFCGEKAENVPLTFDEEKAKIELLIYPNGDTLSYHVSYDANTYTEDFIRDMLAAYERALAEFTKRSDTSEIQLVDEETLERLEEKNRTESDYEITDIVTLFRRRAEQSPDNIAVVYLDHVYTYKEVDRITENIASFLKSKGIGKDQAVSVIIPRCEYMPIAALGVLKAGAGYQPLDPSYPPERLEFMIQDADAKYLIADRTLMDRLPNYNGPVLYTDEIPDLPDGEKISENPDPGDLFIMLYTSGSTGIPKGVMLEHHNLCSFCNWYRQYYNMDETSRAAAYASYGFDAHMMDMYPILISGGQLHIIDEAIRLDLLAIKDYFCKNGITHSFITTQVGRQYADLFPDAKYPHYLSVGGEKLVPIAPPEGFRFFNAYGPTECTIFTHTYPVDKMYRRVPIGRPLFNMKQYVVDKNLNRLPFGIPGELIVAGHQVGRGYLNRPEKNAEVFIRNPFSDEPGYEHAYRTGDIVRILSDGSVDIIGRNDGQVKIRGFRIELSEVEGIIRKFPGIKDATVQAFDETGGGKFIAAYVVADEPVDIDALGAFIKQEKPAYMVPAVTMQIDRIPLNQNQKVNKRALPEPVKAGKTSDNEHQARPLTRFEEEIASVAKRLLGDMEMHPAEPLTSYGLTSISAIGLVATLADKFNVEISAPRLLDGASIIDIENMIFEDWMKQGFANKPEPQNAAAEEKPVTDRAPLSAVQLAVYYDAMKNEADVVYNIPMCLQFDKLDAQKLAEAVKKAVAAHSYLNTHIELCDGELIQVRDDNVQTQVEILTLNEEELEYYKNTFIRPFDLHTGPLYRFAVINSGEKTYLFLDIHHLIYDGMSSGVLLRDIGRAYTGEALSAEEYTYFDYAQESDEFKRSDAYAESVSYFDKMFERFEAPTEIPTDKPGSAENGVIAEAYCPVSKQAVDTFCRQNNMQPSAFFLAAVFYTVSRFAGTKNVYLSTISSGRESVKMRRTVGMFVHTLPLAMSFEENRDVLELINASNSVMRGSIQNENYPFAEIAAKYGYKTEIMYECQIGVVADGGEIGGNAYKSVRLRFEAPKFKTVFAVVEHDNDYMILIRYNDALYSKPYMQTLAQSVKNVTERMTADKSAAVNSLPLITEDEKQSLLALGISAKQEIETKLLHKLFEKAAAADPDKTALIACDKTLTYSELNGNANRIAYYLMDKGVKPGDSIVLLLPRRSSFFEAMFGVLKTGAAFVPCDPEYPAERISHITDDSGSRFIITTEDHASDYPAEKVLLIDSLYDSDNTENPDVAVTGDDLAYMIYTSGSTGKPKGVMLRHEGICNYLLPHPANMHIYKIRKLVSAYLSVTTVSFDMSFKEHTAALCNGKTLVFADENEMNDPRALAELMEKHHVDCINATPSRLQQYMEFKPFRERLGSCKVVLSGGEAYPISLRNAIKECSDDIIIINTYGPTEITVSSNAAIINETDHIHIGRPLLNYSEYIVDSDLNLLPRGVIGELLIGGAGVAKGYRNLPEQTEKSFIEWGGERVYRSGDYAKWDADGNVIILGRMDGQIKLRGLRIELGEIEGLIEQQPGIRRAAAAVRKLSGRENLCAWFTADRDIDITQLREALSQKLTHYMVPAAMMQVESIPVTPNGKTNVKALPDPEVIDSGEYVAPVGKAEEFFCGLFAEILGVEKVGATDDFFSIGGTSLAVTGIMIKATENGYELTYGDVFKYTTPRQLAAKFTGEGDTKTLSAARFDLYNYDKIHELLSHNTSGSFVNGEKRPIGNILLTGATGFMGIHVLAEYLNSYSGTAYCMLRKGRFESVAARVRNMLYYYFGDEFEDKLDRVQAFEGDVTSFDSFSPLLSLPVDTVFNCAASVKHFSSGTDIEDINVGGVQNCIRYCLEKNSRLIHFSTTSVAGAVVAEPGAPQRFLDEHILYYGQILENQYTSSKLLAEREVFESMVENGLDAKVIRVGTLAPRESDGEFQINFLSNSFMGRLRSFAMLKVFPYNMINFPVRMGSIDESAKAFMLLAQTPRECCLFNAINTHSAPLVDIIHIMKELGIEIDITYNEVFEKELEKAEADPDKAAILQSMLAYKNMNGKNTIPVASKFDYTSKVLACMGFYWKNTDSGYIRRFIKALIGLEFFDENNLNR